MGDTGNEISRTDLKVAHTINKHIDENNVQPGTRNLAAQILAPMAEKLVQVETDPVTGLDLNSVTRRNIAERLKKGQTGIVVVVDLVGLKHLNSYGHNKGDEGLKMMANVLGKFGFSELGRKGDEYYGFVEDQEEKDFREKFGDFLRSERILNRLQVSGTNVQLLNYWDCGHIDNVKDLDPLIDRLDKNVEGVKVKIRDYILTQISTHPPKERAELMMLYFNLKIRAEGPEISQFVNSLDAKFRRVYKITDDRNRLDDHVLERIPSEKKSLFQFFQEQALRELNLG